MLTRLRSTNMIKQENRIMLPVQEEKIPSFVQKVLFVFGRIKKFGPLIKCIPRRERAIF
jgi:hypothetical protein